MSYFKNKTIFRMRRTSGQMEVQVNMPCYMHNYSKN